MVARGLTVSYTQVFGIVISALVMTQTSRHQPSVSEGAHL